MKVVIGIGIIVFLSMSATAQSPEWEDVCHVYLVDVEKSIKAQELFFKNPNDTAVSKAMKEAAKEFPEFRTTYKEETATTKHYPFPNSKLFITASVYYTDESLASIPTGKYDISDVSITLGVAVTSRKEEDVLSAKILNATLSEVTYDDFTNQVRVKQYVIVNERKYLVGLQCDCQTKMKLREKAKSRTN